MLIIESGAAAAVNPRAGGGIRRVLVVVQKLPLTFDRRVWLEARLSGNVLGSSVYPDTVAAQVENTNMGTHIELAQPGIDLRCVDRPPLYRPVATRRATAAGSAKRRSGSGLRHRGKGPFTPFSHGPEADRPSP